MITFLFIMVTFIALLSGYYAGWQTHALTHKPVVKAITSTTPRALCLCTHGLNYHIDGGRCQSYKIKIDGRSVSKAYKCECVKYVGPEPLPEYYHPKEIA